MTDEERKKRFETTAKLKVTKEEMSNVSGDAYNDVKYVFAPSIVKSIGGKNEDELFNLLDFWYEELRNNFGVNMLREQFAENIINYIELKKLHVSTEKVRELDLLLITSQQIKWINSWVNDDSPIVRKAFKHPKLRTWFYERAEQKTGEAKPDVLLRDFIKYCETVSPPDISRAASEHLPNHCGKECHDVLKEIGLDVGSDDVWRQSKCR